MGAIFAQNYEFSRWAGKRKHVTQMKPYEQNNLWNRLKRIHNDDWRIDKHAFERVEEKGIRATRDDMISAITNASIIEYKIDYNKYKNTYDERVVLRSNALVNGQYNLNVVYSLTTKRVKTVWLNRIDDKHETLDWGIYNARMKVFA